ASACRTGSRSMRAFRSYQVIHCHNLAALKSLVAGEAYVHGAEDVTSADQGLAILADRRDEVRDEIALLRPRVRRADHGFVRVLVTAEQFCVRPVIDEGELGAVDIERMELGAARAVAAERLAGRTTFEMKQADHAVVDLAALWSCGNAIAERCHVSDLVIEH